MFVHQHLRDVFCDTAEPIRNVPEELEFAFAFVSKCEALAKIDLGGIKTPKDKSQKKVFRVHSRKLRCKVEHHRLIDPQPFNTLHFLVERLKQRRRGRGMQHCARVRQTSKRG